MPNDVEDFSFESLLDVSTKFQSLKRQCLVGVRLSLSGIANLVTNYEDPLLVQDFLKRCFKASQLYNETYDINAIELQVGSPGGGKSFDYLDRLIYGNFETKKDPNLGVETVVVDPQTGKRKRQPNGFVSRKEVLTGVFDDKTLIINSIDYCVDFCPTSPGVIDSSVMWLFDNFRNPSVKMGCRMLLVSSTPLKFPFQVRTIQFDLVDESAANHIIDSFLGLYRQSKYNVVLNETQRLHIARKLRGLNYTQAADVMSEAMASSESKPNSHVVDGVMVVKKIRDKINRNLLGSASGLTHLTPKPWEDYIHPESSGFTYDVKKILRDFNEINRLKDQEKKNSKGGKDVSSIDNTINSIRSRMPHVILLYGRGGVGKSAFPIHFAGLLEFDVWDFNINASHSRWVGEGSKNMREALDQVSKASHLVVRIDEYDRAIGSVDSGGEEMHAAHKQVESEFMNWLQNQQEDNFFVKNDIFLVLTTNHKENITGPLLRSGRVDLVIDIDEFDDQSIKEAFLTAPRRMKSRGVMVLGLEEESCFLAAVEKLDLNQLAPVASKKGFTVRDIDVLLQEMAAHDYYFKKDGAGIAWTTDNFLKVLENSVGSAKTESTAELKLGDRYLFVSQEEDVEDSQQHFEFLKDYDPKCNLESFLNKDVSPFE